MCFNSLIRLSHSFPITRPNHIAVDGLKIHLRSVNNIICSICQTSSDTSATSDPPPAHTWKNNRLSLSRSLRQRRPTTRVLLQETSSGNSAQHTWKPPAYYRNKYFTTTRFVDWHLHDVTYLTPKKEMWQRTTHCLLESSPIQLYL